MKQTFSTILTKQPQLVRQAREYADKKDYSEDDLTEFSALSFIPLYVLYYVYWKDHGVEGAKDHMLRLLDYYEIEYDL